MCHEDIIHSSSDGSTVDVQGPVIIILNMGLFGMENDTHEVLETLNSDNPIYQSQYDSIDFRWNATDDASDVANVTWMAGNLPFYDDIHDETDTIDDQVLITFYRIVLFYYFRKSSLSVGLFWDVECTFTQNMCIYFGYYYWSDQLFAFDT